jgi:hypothetical protein
MTHALPGPGSIGRGTAAYHGGKEIWQTAPGVRPLIAKATMNETIPSNAAATPSHTEYRSMAI